MSAEDLRQHCELMAKLCGKPAGYAHCRNSLMIAHGRSFYASPDTFTGERGERHGCYRNAATIAFDDSRAVYVEGWVHAFIPIEHAWITYDGVHVIDPTLSDHAHVEGYFGIPIRTPWLYKRVFRQKTWGVFGHMHMRDLLLEGAPTDWIHNFNKEPAE